MNARTAGLFLVLLVSTFGTAFAAFRVTDDDYQAGLIAFSATLATALISAVVAKTTTQHADDREKRALFYRVIDLARRYDRTRKSARDEMLMRDALLSNEASPGATDAVIVAHADALKRRAGAATEQAAGIRADLLSAIVIASSEAGDQLSEVLDSFVVELESQMAWTPDEDVTELNHDALQAAVDDELPRRGRRPRGQGGHSMARHQRT